MEQMLYMRLEGIDGQEPIGESQNMIGIQSYKHSVGMPVAPARPSIGKEASFRRSFCAHGAFQVVKGFDKTSPKLFEACANGVVFPNVAVFACSQEFNSQKKSSSPVPMLTINLSDAVMVDFSYGFQGGWQIETIAFRYASIGWKAKWADPETGDSENLEPVGWEGADNAAATISIPAGVKWNDAGLI